MSFAITMLPAVAGHRWVSVEGPVDASAVADVRAVMRAAAQLPARRLTVDLRRATVEDAGMMGLTEALAAAAERGIEVQVVQAGGPAAATLASAQHPAIA
ncbi:MULTISPECIES: hypothetical protein [unclassified Micromonospora]|uniref:hypothetical protein n=1 Tax=unclassified Micromonospora TaxID=2617518 RepID=UPI002FF3799A